jgi:hypothetical protein
LLTWLLNNLMPNCKVCTTTQNNNNYDDDDNDDCNNNIVINNNWWSRVNVDLTLNISRDCKLIIYMAMTLFAL